MTPLEILHKKTATKEDLRQALAKVLQVSMPDFGTSKNTTQTPFKPCLNYFLEAYKKQTKLDYSVTSRDGKALAEIIGKIEKIAQKDVVNTFTYIITHLPQWYVENGFSLIIINSKFNEILASVKQQKTISYGYKESILNDLR